jgi:hypothetical protein
VIAFDTIALSPDGRSLGVIAHGAGDEGANKFELRRQSVVAFVAQVYDDIGLGPHKKGEFEWAAALFHKTDRTCAPKCGSRR